MIEKEILPCFTNWKDCVIWTSASGDSLLQATQEFLVWKKGKILIIMVNVLQF